MTDLSGRDLPEGFTAAGVACGIKASGNLDLALLVADRRCAAAGTFTQNRVAAAPVQWCRGLVPSDRIRAVVVNAGNANAATGAEGLADARRMAQRVADRLLCEPEQVLVASTGVIGRRLPMDRIEAGIAAAFPLLDHSVSAVENASRAILTTDTRPKVVGRRLDFGDDGQASILGIAKGAAMIGPNMATMLAFLLTDARLSPGLLQGILTSAVDDSFNCISVEGHTSTNDTVLLLSRQDGPYLSGEALKVFSQAVAEVCRELAQAIVDDAEGATHAIEILVSGCRDRDEAKAIASTVANSPLVKTAIHGADPNWGRIVSAAGYAGVPFDEAELSLSLNGITLYQAGTPVPFDVEQASQSLRQNRRVSLHLQLTRGEASLRFWTADLTAEYVRLNADYTT
ncbi:MAG: arginine biosynthesis bifunctional protein ArgJ [Isosphaeraceae bacterium]|jgi:glutamate N-acetyltransferase/amino-acid N-acetyltransferase|nr:MAG: arginine biosynthesis bifunctional protein ArgJ [Isosphaeraceae bacterium]